MKATPLDVARCLIAQRGTPTSHPEFIAAYLAEEYHRDPLCAMPVLTRVIHHIDAVFARVGAAVSALFDPLLPPSQRRGLDHHREAESATNGKEMPTIPNGFKAEQVVDKGVIDGIWWITYQRDPDQPEVNGYVYIPEGHLMRGLSHDQVNQLVNVHGGLTFGTGSGWLGFDTMHSGDHWPGGLLAKFTQLDAQITWTPQMVAEEAASLAEQIGDLS